MLEYENSALAQNVATENERNNLVGTLQIVWCVRKNDVETLGTVFQIQKSVRLYRVNGCRAQLARRAADKIVVDGVDFDRRYAAGSARGELVTYRTRPRKEVEDIDRLVIDDVVQHVEQVFLGEIGRRTRPQIAWRVDCPPAICTADYSHTTLLK